MHIRGEFVAPRGIHKGRQAPDIDPKLAARLCSRRWRSPQRRGWHAAADLTLTACCVLRRAQTQHNEARSAACAPGQIKRPTPPNLQCSKREQHGSMIGAAGGAQASNALPPRGFQSPYSAPGGRARLTKILQRLHRCLSLSLLASAPLSTSLITPRSAPHKTRGHLWPAPNPARSHSQSAAAAERAATT